MFLLVPLPSSIYLYSELNVLNYTTASIGFLSAYIGVNGISSFYIKVFINLNKFTLLSIFVHNFLICSKLMLGEKHYNVRNVVTNF